MILCLIESTTARPHPRLNKSSSNTKWTKIFPSIQVLNSIQCSENSFTYLISTYYYGDRVKRMFILIEGRGEQIVFWWPNTNTNIIRVPKNDRIWIRILFGFPKLTEYEYEYYSGFQIWPNTNTNIIRLPKYDRIRILFDSLKVTEYEYEYYLTF